jgi:hypothetical protein
MKSNNERKQGATFTNSGTVTSQLFSTSSQNQAIAVYSGSATIINSGTIKGNVSLATATFTNNSGATWNVNGSNFFGNGTNTINNAGTINVSGVNSFSTAGTLAFDNANAVNVLADSYAFIGGAVSGFNGTSGTFSIGDFSTLEFASSVAAGQTISFVDSDGSLTIDNASGFDGTIAMQIGNTISMPGVSIQSVAVNTEVVGGTTEEFLQVTQSNNQPLFLDNFNSATGVYEGVLLSNFPASAQFSVLSPDEILLAPNGAATVTGSLGPTTEPGLSSPQFYILSNATISGSGGVGFSASSSDSTPGDFLTVEITQGSSISGLSGTFNGVNLTSTAGANIALIDAGSITSTGGRGINTANSGNGSTIIVDYGNVTGATNGINATTSGTGPINIVVSGGATITGTGGGTTTNPGFAISAVSLGGEVIVNTSPGNTLSSGSSGINAQDQGTSIAKTSNSSISISAYGTINSGATPPSTGNEPAGIKAGYNGGTGAPTTAVFGNVTVENNANITAAGGLGIFAFNDGVGNVSITDGPGTTIKATLAGTTGEGTAQYGIGAFSQEAGNISVITAPGSIIDSGSSGIEALNQATSTTNPDSQTTSITVIAQGTINSGANEDNGGFAQAGIEAGFTPSVNSSQFDSSVVGSVFVDLSGGSISAASGIGIKAFNYGV